MEEEELGQLGVLYDQADATTEWGLRASYRLTAMKTFVKIDCGRRYAAAILRKSTALPTTNRVGDVVMYYKKQGSAEPGTEC